MSLRTAALWLILCVSGLAALPVCADADPPADPLPQRALARLGTVRFRYGGRMRALVIAPNGRLVAAGGDELIHVWETSSGKEVHRLRNPWVCTLAFAPDSNTLAAGTGIGTIHLWDLATGKELRHFGGGDQGEIRALAFAPGGTLLASASIGGIRLWRVATGAEAGRLTGHEGPIDAVAFAPRGTALAGAGRGVFLWEPGSGKLLGKFSGPRSAVAVSFTPDGNRVAALGNDCVLRVWEGSAGKERLQVPGWPNRMVQAALTADGKRAVLLGKDHVLHRWDLEACQELPPVHLETDDQRMFTLSPDGQLLATVENSHTIRLWNTENGKERTLTPGHRGDILAVAYSSNGKALTSVAWDRTVRSWDAVSGKETHVVGAWSPNDQFLALATDGKTVAVRREASGGGVALVDAAAGKERRRFPGLAWAAALSGDGSFLAVSHAYEPIRLWHLAQGGGPLRLAGHPEGAITLAFSPDHELLASAGAKQDIRLWDVATGKERAVWKTGRSHHFLVFSPDGATLATENQDGMIALRDVVTGQEVRQLQGHTDAIHALAFAPDGHVLASGGADSHVRVWELTSGQEVRRFLGHSGPVTAIAFAPDGRSLASGSTDTSVLIWDLTGQGRAGVKVAVHLRPEDLDRLWEQLAGPDSSKAYDAVWSLAGQPEDSLPYLRQRLELFLGTDPQRIEHLIGELDHDRYDVREKATADLEKLGKWAEPALRKHLTGKPTLEVQRRIERILDKIKGGLSWDRERLRVVRATAILEAIASPAARQALEKIARRAPEDELRAQAQAALKRLERHNR